MNTFKKNKAIVIDYLKKRDFSETSVQVYEMIYSSIESYLNEKGLIYSPELGEEFLLLDQNSFFTKKGMPVRASSIHKLAFLPDIRILRKCTDPSDIRLPFL